MVATLDRVLAALGDLAPLDLAEDWDNVGLLVDVVPRRRVRRVLLTVDLTEPVFEEALSTDCELIVAYHPPIFAGLKRLTAAVPGERILLRAIRRRIAIYSPHTALDSVAGGVNDWLADALGAAERRPLRPGRRPDGSQSADSGQGRHLTLARPLELPSLIRKVKSHLGIPKLRLAATPHHREGESVRTVALCAGAGGSILAGQPVDLLWTGEMRHHDVLAAVAAGSSVLLAEHSHTERGYLPVLAKRLAERLGTDAPDCHVSVTDADPLIPT